MASSLSALAWGMAAAGVWGLCAPAISVALGHDARIWPVMLWLFLFSLLTSFGAAVAVEGVSRWSAQGAAEAGGMGLLYTAADFFYFAAVRAGRVTVVAPVVACNGAVSALLAVLTGSALTGLTASGLAVILLGVVALTSASSTKEMTTTRDSLEVRALLLAAASALLFGVAFFVGGRITSLEPTSVVALSRAACVLMVLPICVGVEREPIRVPRRALLWAGLAGVLDAAGYIAFIEGAGHNLPIAAITTSQWAGVAVIVGLLALRERLSVRQGVGVVLLAVGGGIVAAAG